jgi:hypothetical protein
MPLVSHSFNFAKMITWLLGNLHRRPRRIAWLKACLKPLQSIHAKFIAFTDSKFNEIKYNGQTFVLEQLLRKQFGAGIYIINNSASLGGLTIGDGNDWSSSIGSGFDFGGAIGVSFSVALFDFTIHVPASVVFVQSEMEAVVRKYKMFGTTFNIVIE